MSQFVFIVSRIVFLKVIQWFILNSFNLTLTNQHLLHSIKLNWIFLQLPDVHHFPFLPIKVYINKLLSSFKKDCSPRPCIAISSDVVTSNLRMSLFSASIICTLFMHIDFWLINNWTAPTPYFLGWYYTFANQHWGYLLMII